MAKKNCTILLLDKDQKVVHTLIRSKPHHIYTFHWAVRLLFYKNNNSFIVIVTPKNLTKNRWLYFLEINFLHTQNEFSLICYFCTTSKFVISTNIFCRGVERQG